MVTCSIYRSEDEQVWDQFVESCRTPMFFFKRGYMDYHADRFIDHSLLFENNGKIVAIFPASWNGQILTSHGGLTYGGILLSPTIRAADVEAVYEALLNHSRMLGAKKIVYKAIPYIFAKSGSQEDLYFIFNASRSEIVRRDLSSVVTLSEPVKLSKGRKWLIARAKKEGLTVSTSENWESFHGLLSSVLVKHGAKPVHSVEELRLLGSRFLNEIKLRVVECQGTLLAAMLLFRFARVDHSQYLAVSEEGKEKGALDLLINECLKDANESGQEYFSFGISTYDQGRALNGGLIAQKEGFGARGLVLDFYEINL